MNSLKETMKITNITLEQMKELYIDASSDVADEHYPKGDKRRGRYIMDQALIWVKLEEQLRKYIGEIGGQIKDN